MATGGESGSEGFTVLFVAEKPAIARAIATALTPPGTRYWQERSKVGCAAPVYCLDAPWLCQSPRPLAEVGKVRLRVTSTFGHIYSVDFPSSLRRWSGVDPESLFGADVEWSQHENGRSRILEHLSSEAQHSHLVGLWLDCDREGENICYEVLGIVLGRLVPHANLQAGRPLEDVMESDYSHDPRVWRASFSSLATSDLQRAFRNLQKPNPWHAKAVQARQVIDLKVGVALTRLITTALRDDARDLVPGHDFGRGPLISYGPCQTPTLSFCVRRWDDMRRFRKQVSYTIEADILAKSGIGSQIRLQWEPPTEELQGIATPSRKRLRLPKYQVEQLLGEAPPGCPAIVHSSSVDVCQVQGPVALNTVAMLQAASRELGLGPQRCMQVAERLYLAGLLTYPRTETTHYPASLPLAGMVWEHSWHTKWGHWCRQLLHSGLKQPKLGQDRGDHPP
eukprot:CAMPEP_0203920626 /NCGR_PEP_ID=MMETSP0359-20131031/60912_1 /ASSEMBLY_ACC=CAM_ASM_000338 /TAXON_ID=268821 /ORGANISM="Scrippsiella Hangoei, Strain SHTV-5" /LENGTH=450 /DNA_ID=CAMNT_0050848171 /DNA_START=70 /DNA_END=1418 /DNA_ORIENTATION=+